MVSRTDWLATASQVLISNPPIVTDVEISSTAPAGGKRRWSVWFPAALCGVVITLVPGVLLGAARPAAADSLSNARGQAAQIASEIQSQAAQVDAISQQYEEAQTKVQQLDSQVQQIHTTIATDQAQVQSDQANLRREAIRAYVSSGSDPELESLFAPSGQTAAIANEYRSVANGNITNAIDSLDIAQKTLATQQQQLQSAQAQAQAALNSVASSRQAAEGAVAKQQATLAGLKGQIASLVEQQQATRQAAGHASFVSRASASANLPNLPASGGASGAVRAAESQIGVPYRWGGEQPGVGFDCSGLTQWSWRQAGVGIPRTAQAQYDAIPHVSLGNLEPGDLLFWGYGTGDIYHVAMYVGNGDVIQAPQTGEDVQIDPIYGNQLVGAGRP